MERKGVRGHGKAEQGGRKDRRSATGMNGEPKKGGHGGKFTWAGDQRHSKAEYGGMEKGARRLVIREAESADLGGDLSEKNRGALGPPGEEKVYRRAPNCGESCVEIDGDEDITPCGV
ncbi:hypothetical protein BHE74_00018171 [Ensete ventricosum]|nr:hypothetical protein BHE74_00018171 [Ensete ventricosum]